jgi:hypothetical protein
VAERDRRWRSTCGPRSARPRRVRPHARRNSAIAWNRLFLVYVALLSLTLFTIIRALITLDPQPIAQRFGEHAPVRSVGLFLWAIGGMLGLMELFQIIPALATGDIPDIETKRGHPTGVIYILGLGLVVPLMLLTGSWIRARRPWGTSRRRSCWSRRSPKTWGC